MDNQTKKNEKNGIKLYFIIMIALAILLMVIYIISLLFDNIFSQHALDILSYICITLLLVLLAGLWLGQLTISLQLGNLKLDDLNDNQSHDKEKLAKDTRALGIINSIVDGVFIVTWLLSQITDTQGPKGSGFMVSNALAFGMFWLCCLIVFAPPTYISFVSGKRFLKFSQEYPVSNLFRYSTKAIPWIYVLSIVYLVFLIWKYWF